VSRDRYGGFLHILPTVQRLHNPAVGVWTFAIFYNSVTLPTAALVMFLSNNSFYLQLARVVRPQGRRRDTRILHTLSRSRSFSWVTNSRFLKGQKPTSGLYELDQCHILAEVSFIHLRTRFVISKFKLLRFGGFGGQLVDRIGSDHHALRAGPSTTAVRCLSVVRLANVKANKQ